MAFQCFYKVVQGFQLVSTRLLQGFCKAFTSCLRCVLQGFYKAFTKLFTRLLQCVTLDSIESVDATK
jgi:hypothetical protein